LRGEKHFDSTSYFLYAWFAYIAHKFFSFYYTKAILVRRKHRNNALTTTAIGLHHTGTLNNSGKMKICKKHQTIEAIE